jgi:7-cyano-7-deazaguanine synthase
VDQITSPPHSAGHRYDVLLLFSGGPDALVLLYFLLKEKRMRPLTLHFRGLTSEYELIAARQIAAQAQVELQVIDMRSFMSACTHHLPPSPGEGRRIYFGNAVVLSMAVTLAIQQQIPSVAVGLHREDADDYIENTPAFMDFLAQGIDLIGRECDLYLPFHSWTKAEVLRKGVQLQAPFEATWSCITPVEGRQDGTCSSCRARRASFEAAGIPDPTIYARTS